MTQSTGRVRDQRWVLTLLRAVRRGVVEIRYRSPWKEEASTHQFEPWQLWLHDGVLYVRGYSRTRKAPRTFRLAGIDRLAALPGQVPTAPVPARGHIWGEGDPRLGVDEDRPDTAKIKFRGPIVLAHPAARSVGGTSSTGRASSPRRRSPVPHALKGRAAGQDVRAPGRGVWPSRQDGCPPFLDARTCAGFFVWRLYTGPDDVSQEAEWGFSPRGNLAELVLRDAFAARWATDGASLLGEVLGRHRARTPGLFGWELDPDE